MVEATLYQNEKIVMQREFDDPASFNDVLKKMEAYVLAEQINSLGEVLIRTRFR